MWLRKKKTDVFDGEMIPVRDVVKLLDSSSSGYYREAQAGRGINPALANPMSGMGGIADKSGFFQFIPAWLQDKQTIESLIQRSWAAARFIHMPVDDMFTKPRQYEDDDLKEIYEVLKADQKLASTMSLGRAYGTGLIWAVTSEADPEEPLDLNKIRPGDLTNLIVVDQHDVQIISKNRDPESVSFGTPELYDIRLNGSGTFRVHASRVYRFDGLEPGSINGWTTVSDDWGISNLAQTVNEIMGDSAVVQSVNQLVQEASIPVQKMKGLKDLMCQAPCPDEPSVEQQMAEFNRIKSIYSTILMDADDTFERVSVNFSGLPDIIEKYVERLAISAGISVTRFLGTSPDGMNSTGEGDMRNDNRTTAKNQHLMLRPAYRWLDEIASRSVNTEVPEYIFPPLWEPTPKESSDVEKDRTETANMNVMGSIWTEQEAKDYIATGIIPKGDLETDPSEDDEKTMKELMRGKTA